MPTCKICDVEIARGKSYKGQRYKNERFCSKECYEKRCNATCQPGTDSFKRRKVTDTIQEMWGLEANWTLLTKQLKDIMREYNLDYNDVYYVLKYCQIYEQVVIDEDYGLYQIFPKYIALAQKFKAKLQESKVSATKWNNEVKPIKVKKYHPNRKIGLTFDN